jgi:predicted metalloprotease with PDZ domain
MRSLNENYAKAGRFYQESDALRSAMEDIIRQKAPSADASLADFFQRYISGTDEIPYADFLARAGWTMRDTSQHRAALGFSVNRDSAGSTTIASLDRESGASDAGLKEGDVLLLLNGELFPRAPDRWLRDHQPEERVTIKVQRSGEGREFSFPLGRQNDAAFQITEIASPTERQRRVRDGILRGVTTP